MSGEEKLGKLRAKLKEITEHIDNADQRKTDCKHATVEACARLEKLEVEHHSAKRRIQLIRKDLEDSSERLTVAEEKYGKSTAVSEEAETARQELEQKESEDDETIQNLEASVKEMKRTLEMNELKVVEGQRKRTVCNHDIERIKEKADTFEKRVALLEETIEKHGQSLQDLETREGECGDREALNEEKIAFLESQFKETEVRAEAAERGCAVLKNNMLETENEINSWIVKREEIENQMILMDDVADDPSYVMADADGYHSSDSRPTTPSTLKEKAGIFGKKREDDDQSVSSRASSRQRDPEPEPEPEPTPPEEAQEEEDEEEVEEEKVSEQESVPPPQEEEKVEEESEEEESEEEESDDEWN